MAAVARGTAIAKAEAKECLMPATHVLLTCPGCGAALSLIVEPTDVPEHGALLCDHGHIYDLDDPDDARELQAALGPAYLNCLRQPPPHHAGNCS